MSVAPAEASFRYRYTEEVDTPLKSGYQDIVCHMGPGARRYRQNYQHTHMLQ